MEIKKKNKKKIALPEIKSERVVGIEAKILPDIDGEGLVIRWQIKPDIVDGKGIVIRLKCTVSPEIEGDFKIVVEHVLTYKHTAYWTLDKIKERIDDFVDPCLSKNSFIVADLANHLFNDPLIIPPILFQSEIIDQ